MTQYIVEQLYYPERLNFVILPDYLLIKVIDH